MKKYNLNTLSPAEIVDLVVADGELKLSIADNMAQYGGSFVKALAECFYHADYNNLRRLTETFIDYVLEYQPNK